MNKDIQSTILRACARFIAKKVDPLTKQIEDLRTKSAPDLVGDLLSTDRLKTLVDLHVAQAVADYFEANPIQHGRDGEKGDPGDRGEKGMDGADGVGLAGAMINRDCELVITTTKGDPVVVGRVVGSDGAPGQNGRDGADFSDVELDYDGERGLTIRGKGGEITKRLPIPIYRGYWREGMKAEKSDIVTEAGSAWIALKDTDKKPAIDAGDWLLYVRKGRDGAQGAPGMPYKAAEPVKLT